jgi:hypothetical protein
MILTKSFIGKLFLCAVITAASIMLAGTAHAFDGAGTGTIEDPFQITSCLELQSINSYAGDEYYEIANDIDCADTNTWNTGLGFDPIDYFEGVLDGQGYTISNLYINRTTEIVDNSYIGLFEYLGGFVFNLNLSVGATGEINGPGGASNSIVGSLAATIPSGGLVIGVTSDIPVSGKTVGGLVGSLNYGTIVRSSYSGTVTGTGTSNVAGGIVGNYFYGGLIENVYFSGDVSGDTAGGLAGGLYGGAEISKSYAAGTVTAATAGGGLVGTFVSFSNQDISDAFAAVTIAGAGTLGGVVGTESIDGGAFISNVWFDENLAGTTSCMGSNDSVVVTTCYSWDSSGEDAAYLKNNDTDAPVDNWDFDNTYIWEVDTEFPVLLASGPFSAPDEPSNLLVTYDEVDIEYDFSWDENIESGDLPTLYFEYDLQLAGGDWSTLLDSDTTEGTTADFNEYYVGLEYEFRVRAVNVYGPSDWVEVSFIADDATTHNISSCLELMAIDDVVDTEKDAYYLTQDIDCTGVDFEPIGSDEWSAFEGLLDGQGYTISNLTIDSEDSEVGLFKELYVAVVRDLTIDGGTITGSSSSVGALAGYAESAYIANISVNVNVVGDGDEIGGLIGHVYTEDNLTATIYQSRSLGSVTTEDGDGAGGLVGYVEVYEEGVINITESYAAGDVIGYAYVGGLIGEVYAEGYDNDGAFVYIIDSYATGDVTGTDYDAGGLLGHVEPYYDDEPAGIIIRNVYASGDVSGPSPTGGLIAHPGYADDEEDQYIVLENSFSAGALTSEDSDDVGGLVGDFGDEVGFLYENLYWDVTLSGISVCDGNDDMDTAECTGITEAGYFADVTNQPFAGNWDDTDVWYFSGEHYPVLRAFDTDEQLGEVIVVEETTRRRSSSTAQSKAKAQQVFSEYYGTEDTPSNNNSPDETSTLNSGQCPANLIVTQNLKQGARDGQYHNYTGETVQEVALVQQHINRILANYFDQAAGPVDGIFGPLTKQGVQRLQQTLRDEQGADLGPGQDDGIVGPMTRDAINGSCGDMEEVTS